MVDRLMGDWCATARQQLKSVSEQPALEVSLLAASVLHKNRSWVLAHPEAVLLPIQEAALNQMLERLKNGTPLPYLTGNQEFFGLPFLVSAAVLIPRPETELLVEQALTWLQQHPAMRHGLDIGTGSGCIAITLAAKVNNLAMVACDISSAALEVARENSLRHNTTRRVQFVQSDLTTAISGPFDLICANLPYIPTPALQGLQVARHEPVLALDGGGQDGLGLIARLLTAAPSLLAAQGMLLLEIEASQGASATAFARGAFPTARIQLLQDLAGLDRLVRIDT